MTLVARARAQCLALLLLAGLSSLAAAGQTPRPEFERYWLHHLLFGRLAGPQAEDGASWLNELRARFGPAAKALHDACEAASAIVPFLAAYRVGPAGPEPRSVLQTGGLLDLYVEARPGDPARFATFQEDAAARLRGPTSARMRPDQAAARLLGLAETTERALARAESLLAGRAHRDFAADRTDLEILALLGRYHAQKIRAAASLALFYASGDVTPLVSAQLHAAAGLEIWRRLAAVAEVHHPRMVFGPGATGHWRDALPFVRHDVKRLREVERLFDRYGLFALGLDFGPGLPARPHGAGEPAYLGTHSVERRFRLLAPETTYDAARGYGWVDRAGVAASPPFEVPRAALEGASLEGVGLPADVLYRDFLEGTRASRLRIDLPDGDWRVTAIVANQPELATGAFQIRGPGGAAIPYAVGETGDRSMDVKIAGGVLELAFVPEPEASWLVSGLVVTRRAPAIAHVPVAVAAPGARVRIAATITAPDGVAEALLHYQVAPGGPVATVLLLREGRRFAADLPAPARPDGAEIRYAVSARDGRGTAAQLPPRGSFLLRLGRDTTPPEIAHAPVTACRPGEALRLAFTIRDPAGVAVARLHYRALGGPGAEHVLDLGLGAGDYRGEIPASAIDPSHDLIYRVEAVDRFGNGALYPDPDRGTPYVVVTVRR